MAASDVAELFAQTLQCDYDDDAPWEAVRSLHGIGTRQVFEYAAAWIQSDDPLRRARGLDVLAQLGKTAEHSTNSFPEECYAVVANAVQQERQWRPLSSALYALGHLYDNRAVPLIASYHAYPATEVRFAVAFALGCFPNDPLSAKTLLDLVKDPDDEVRDWATFALGVLGDQDSTNIRDALYAKLDDPSADVREEALVGLAKRHDSRGVPSLISALEQPAVTDRIVEAAYTLLGFERDQKEWSASDYLTALQQRFPAPSSRQP